MPMANLDYDKQILVELEKNNGTYGIFTES
ncbi:hypothetical protein J2Z66_008367 [Paenibacillus eucommiae]|uniref:Uncharacterized protein n=1 Tax=Paenibacillus eucommiae TaxID=1355755 RepID=A0ABS4JDD3_9BACL|nr:hypothetical protein [Paenibacillus eucommiae]